MKTEDSGVEADVVANAGCAAVVLGGVVAQRPRVADEDKCDHAFMNLMALRGDQDLDGELLPEVPEEFWW